MKIRLQISRMQQHLSSKLHSFFHSTICCFHNHEHPSPLQQGAVGPPKKGMRGCTILIISTLVLLQNFQQIKISLDCSPLNYYLAKERKPLRQYDNHFTARACMNWTDQTHVVRISTARDLLIWPTDYCITDNIIMIQLRGVSVASRARTNHCRRYKLLFGCKKQRSKSYLTERFFSLASPSTWNTLRENGKFL